jgi:hypothetical protein
MVQGVKMKNRGSSEGKLNAWDSEGRKAEAEGRRRSASHWLKVLRQATPQAQGSLLIYRKAAVLLAIRDSV